MEGLIYCSSQSPMSTTTIVTTITIYTYIGTTSLSSLGEETIRKVRRLFSLYISRFRPRSKTDFVLSKRNLRNVI